MATKKDDVVELPAEKKMWQVRFGKTERDGSVTLNGHGQQVQGATEAEVRAEMARCYGEDYEIVELTPL